MDADDKRDDVDKEFFILFSVIDENLSWYLKDNIENYTNPRKVDEEDKGFEVNIIIDYIIKDNIENQEGR